MFKEEGGFGKWSIAINEEDSSIEIEFQHHPNYGRISLADLDLDTCKKLGKMFLAAIRKNVFGS